MAEVGDLLDLTDELAAQLDPPQDRRPDPVLPDPAQKWVWRSALQKAIRRGQQDMAQLSARHLRAIDPTYFWRGLAVIAVEDVGFGDPDSITFTTAARSKTVRDRLGQDDRLASGLIRRMCVASKSRACCELSLAVELGRPDFIERLARAPDIELLRSAEHNNIGMAYAALGLIRGQFPGRLARDQLLRDAVEEVIAGRLSATPSLARAAVHAFRRPGDSMFVALMLVAEHAQRQPDLTVQEERLCWPASEMIGGVPAEALDLHCRPGQLALKALYSSLSTHHRWLTAIPPQAAVKALGAAVFVEEGGLLDWRITSGSLTILREAQDAALMTAYGVPPDLHQPVRLLIAAELPVLVAKRRWAMALDNATAQSPTP